MLSLAVASVTLLILFLIGFQVVQAIDDKKHHGSVSGVVLDQDGKPLAGAEVTVRSWNWRMYIPIPFSPTRTVQKTIKARTDERGTYSISGPYPRTDLVDVSKTGYRQDGRETECMWHAFGAPKRGSWDFHLFDEALVREDQIKKSEFTSIRFSTNGQIGINLLNGTVSDLTNADIVFEWRQLRATADHGDYGRFRIYSPLGGLWFWEQERLFAPMEGYEKGMTFFFGTKFFGNGGYPYSSYPYRRRAEFYVKSRKGKIYARAYVELNTADHTLSLRVRANASGSRFVDAKGGAYVMGVYSSMSPIYLQPEIPWWISMDPLRAQVIMPSASLIIISTNFPGYFAEHYQTPSDILQWMVNSDVIRQPSVPRSLARNYAAPTNVLQKLIEMDPNGNRWFGKDAHTVLDTSEEIKKFLTESLN